MTIKDPSPVVNQVTNVDVNSPGPISRFELHVIDPRGTKKEYSVDIDSPCTAPCNTKVSFPWKPEVEGKHPLQAFAKDAVNHRGWTEIQEVQVIYENPGII